MYEITSQRGQPQRVINNFKYRYLGNTSQGSVWRCTLKDCNAKISHPAKNERIAKTV